MLRAAALLFLALDGLDSETLRALGASEDARAVPHLSAAIADRVRLLEEFPPALAPPHVEEELEAALVSLQRLDESAALAASREILGRATSDELAFAARRVLARGGELDVIREALRRYFADPESWRGVLREAAADVRLRDFGPRPPAAPTSEMLSRTRLAAQLGATIPAPGSNHDALAARDVLAIHRDVLALLPRERAAVLRMLARRDHEALVGLPMTAATVDRLFPYFARSRHDAVRRRVRRATNARARALRSLLEAPGISDPEKREHADAMKDAWADTVVTGGYDVLSAVVGERAVVEQLLEEEVGEALVFVDDPDARRRLASVESVDTTRWLGRRADAALALPVLTARRQSRIDAVRLAAELELLRMGAPGSDTFLRSRLQSSQLAAIVPTVSEAPVAPALMQQAIERVARDDGRSPDAFAAMSRFHEQHPDRFLSWLSTSDRALLERTHFVMALSGAPRRIPLLIELVTTPHAEPVRDAAFRGLAEVELGSFDKRLHRLAGAADRATRFGAAVALAPSGEEWALRLLFADLDPESCGERRRARRAVARLPDDVAVRLLERMIRDGTATVLAIELYLDRAGDPSALREQMWQLLAPHVEARSAPALMTASRIVHPKARAAIERFLAAP